MLTVEPYANHVASRLLDFFADAAPWQRRLWGLGSLLSLEEVLEASRALRVGVLGEASFKNTVECARETLRQDRGFTSQELGAAQQALSGAAAPEGIPYRRLVDLIARVRPVYLQRWAAALSSEADRPKPERVARAIASHLLDAGYSPRHLHRWWNYRMMHDSTVKSLSNLVAEASALVDATPSRFRVLVAFRRAPRVEDKLPPEWLTSSRASQWLAEHGFDTTGLRQTGALLLTIEALDAVAAIDVAGEVADRLVARAAIGSKARLEPVEQVWVEGERKPFQLRRNRGVQVHAIERENKLFTLGHGSRVDDALEMLGPLNSAAPGPAVASGWAAIEALLTGPGDGGNHVVAADRLAALVACSFPRAELTTLAWTLQELGSPLAEVLRGCASNVDRAQVLAQRLQSGSVAPIAGRESDNAALDRMTKLLANPAAVLGDVREHASRVFRRLYRQRNLVLHGGMVDGASLKTTLRTAAPLVGAGIDRVAHAWFVDGLDPLTLCARAENKLAFVGGGSNRACLHLLDR